MADSLSVAVAGLGAVGMKVATALNAGMEGLELVAVSARDCKTAATRVSAFSPPPAVLPLKELPGRAQIVVECLPPGLFREIAEPVLSRGGILVAASTGALLSAEDLIETARASGGRIILPSGALAGLDGLAAAREAGLDDVALVTRKPPSAFGPTVVEELQGCEGKAVCIFTGNAREAVAAFPQNVNVAATVSLAGLGPERTRVEIWCDPAVRTNRHELFVRSAPGEMRIEVANLPDPENPKSSAITGHSLIAALRRVSATLVIGS